MMHQDTDSAFFWSQDDLPRVYALGLGSSLDMSGSDDHGSTVLVSAASSVSLQHVLLGRLAQQDQWTKGWDNSTAAQSWAAGVTFTSSHVWTPNDRNFPAGGLTTGPNLNATELEALLVGMYVFNHFTHLLAQTLTDTEIFNP